jgi:hypothetical protein
MAGPAFQKVLSIYLGNNCGYDNITIFGNGTISKGAALMLISLHGSWK